MICDVEAALEEEVLRPNKLAAAEEGRERRHAPRLRRVRARDVAMVGVVDGGKVDGRQAAGLSCPLICRHCLVC